MVSGQMWIHDLVEMNKSESSQHETCDTGIHR